MSRRINLSLLSLLFLVNCIAQHGALAANAPETALAYQTPVAELQAIVDAPRVPLPFVSPDGNAVALLGYGQLPSIAVVAQPQARLAGLRFNPQLRLQMLFNFGNALTILDVATQQNHLVQGLPAKLQIVTLDWSPDSNHIAFSAVQDNGIYLWLIDTKTYQAHRATNQPLNVILGRGFDWLGGSKKLIVKLRPTKEGSIPHESATPIGPNVQFTDGSNGASQVPTYEDLLKTPFDEVQLDFYLRAQVGILDLNGNLKRIGATDQLLSVEPSPDGQHLLVSRLRHPYSRIVPIEQFPKDSEVWDMNGKVIEQLAQSPLIEVIAPGPDAVNPGKRGFSWREDKPATVFWIEAQDNGDPRTAVEFRDIVYTADIAAKEKKTELVKLPRRFRSAFWARNDLALITDWTWKTRDSDILRINPSQPGQAANSIFSWKSEDSYNDPGLPETFTSLNGARLLKLSGDTAFMIGTGASPEGDRPFLNRVNLTTREVQTLWRSKAPFYERPLKTNSDAGLPLLTLRETVTEPANIIYHASPLDAGVMLTHYTNPTPQLAGITKQMLRYRRSDGVELTAKLYLPAGYDAKRDGPLPTLLWAYPREFKTAASASQVKGSPYRFNAVSYWGPLPFLARGYAVLDDPTMPIIGEGNAEPNDTYVTQLVADAQAAIDEVVSMGVGDRNRMAIGGHSYGAFMTANLLTHSRLFKAGIARSGAYNRTLTPFGFQAEDRNFWKVPDIYLAMSPFVHADQIKDPLLLIHGEMDNNSGTFPIQSERLYQAMKGLGGKTRLVLLPNESHGYYARESILHMLWEEDQWLDTYVKNAHYSEGH